MTAVFKDAGIQAGSGVGPDFFQDAGSSWWSSIHCGNMMVIVLGLRKKQSTWDSYMASMEGWESRANLSGDDLLGKVTVLCASGSRWEDLLETAHGLYPYREIESFPVKNGQLARLDWKWSGTGAYYLFQQQDAPAALARFFGSGLPLFEAGMLRLNMVCNLYRDRNSTITREISSCDTRLSNILHTELVSETAAMKKVEELEEQVQELSSSYGILAGDYNMIREGISRINGLLQAVLLQIKGEYFWQMDSGLEGSILNPYYRRLSELKSTADELRASRENHQAAIDVVRSRIDIMLSFQNIETQGRIKTLMELNTSMQKQSLTFQIAAGIIEFIVLAYYSHSLWKNLAHNAYNLIPPGVQLFMVVLFSWTAVYCTHLIAEYRQGDHHVRGRMMLYSGLLLALLFIIVFGSYWLELNAGH